MRIQRWLYTLPLRLRSVFRRDQVENELDEEIRYHVEKQTEEYTAQGLRPTEARAAALRAIGGLEPRKEECRDHRGVSVLENLLRDTKYAFRTLRRDSGFTIGVLLLLVVGIGANVAVFSIVNGILLRPPVPRSGSALCHPGDTERQGNRPIGQRLALPRVAA